MKSKIFLLIVVCTLTLFAGSLHAQVKAGSFSVSPIIGYSKFAKTSYFEGTSAYGISLGYNFSDRFGIEAAYNTLDTEIIPEGVDTTAGGGGFPPGPPPPASFRGAGSLVASQGPPPPGGGGGGGGVELVADGGTEVSGSQLRIEGLFYIYPGEKFAPYVAMGIGTMSMEVVGKKLDQLNAPAGFGFKYFITDNIAIRADVRANLPVDDNNILATVGATFQFGGR